MRKKVFLNQQPTTPAPGDTVTVSLVDKFDKAGNQKVKNDKQEGKAYTVVENTGEKKWKNDFGEFITYYLTISDDPSATPAGKTTSLIDEEARKAIKILEARIDKLSGEGGPQDEDTPVGPSESPGATQTKDTSTADSEIDDIPF